MDTLPPQSPSEPPPLAPLPTIKPLRWDIGWPSLIIVGLILFGIYLAAVDSNFTRSLNGGGVYAAGHIIASLLIIPIGAFLGLPIWFLAWLFSGRQRISFKPFVLFGITLSLLLGAAGRRYVESSRTENVVTSDSISAKIERQQLSEIDRLDSQPVQPTKANSLVTEWRQSHTDDLRSDTELTIIFGQLNDKDGRFGAYPDFLQEYRVINSQLAGERAIVLARNAKTLNESQDNQENIRESLSNMKGDLKVVGWEATDYGDGTFLARYKFAKDGVPRAWFLEVNTRADIVRDVSKDESLRKKYRFKPVE